jgi:hypothetical protein
VGRGGLMLAKVIALVLPLGLDTVAVAAALGVAGLGAVAIVPAGREERRELGAIPVVRGRSYQSGSERAVRRPIVRSGSIGGDDESIVAYLVSRAFEN